MVLRIFVMILLSFSVVEGKSLVMTVFKSNDFVMKEQIHLQNHLSKIVSKILGSEWKLITGENIGVELEKKNLEMEDCVEDCSLNTKSVLGADWIFICKIMNMDKFMNVSIELYDKEDNLVDVVDRDLTKSRSDILSIKSDMSLLIDKFRKYFPRKDSYGVAVASNVEKRYDYSFRRENVIRKSNGAYNKVRRNVRTNSGAAAELLNSLDRRKDSVSNKYELEVSRDSRDAVYSADYILKGLKSKNKESSSSISRNSNLPSRLGRRDILLTIRKNQHSVNACKKLVTEKTRVSIRIIINKNGKVSSASLVSPAQLQGSPLDKCLVNQASRFVFPKFNGADMGIKIPFIL